MSNSGGQNNKLLSCFIPARPLTADWCALLFKQRENGDYIMIESERGVSGSTAWRLGQPAPAGG